MAGTSENLYIRQSCAVYLSLPNDSRLHFNNHLTSHEQTIIMGSVFSAIGRGINAIISAIAAVLETIVGAITTVIVTIFDVITDIICCRCCGSRRSGRRYGRRRRGAATY
ncbi:unnamed protein product [Mycena citricolor]|uniref:Uncharacterized protein n=1 Tax=Mycena citricolor TaxID=2018698 RepID=A0AAD2Q5C3_9AGAR|nr:unnamed protein product [Mycena citricolor]CAK5277946.1 unnamed protein product [Mycena citricolor]